MPIKWYMLDFSYYRVLGSSIVDEKNLQEELVPSGCGCLRLELDCVSRGVDLL